MPLTYPYYIFGSGNSSDIDVLIEHPDAIGLETDGRMIRPFQIEHPETADWDINFIKIKDGVVTHSIPSKGTPDAVHNSLFYTYSLHEQQNSQPLHEPVVRILQLAVVRCVRAVLLLTRDTLSDDYYQKNVRPVRKTGNWASAVALLTQLDFELPLYSDENKNLKELKSIAFFLGQTISLFEGIEIYTKNDLIKHHPELEPIINRKSIKVNALLLPKAAELSRLINAEQIDQLANHQVKWRNLAVDFTKEKIIQWQPPIVQKKKKKQ